MVKKHVIAIDGPSGAGKTSTSKLVAGKLGYTYVDTGAMYRAIAWKSLDEGIDPSDRKSIIRMLGSMRMKVEPRNNKMRICIDGKDVTNKLRARNITQRSSVLSAIGEVRKYLVGIQRKAGAKGGVVMEGRDIGTVIFPGTPYKFFLDASIDKRAKRRFLELKEQGSGIKLARIKEDIKARDRRDSTRKVCPLTRAGDAVLIDSTNMKLKDVANCITNAIKQ